MDREEYTKLTQIVYLGRWISRVPVLSHNLVSYPIEALGIPGFPAILLAVPRGTKEVNFGDQWKILIISEMMGLPETNW